MPQRLRGFTLIEVLAAFAVLAIGITVVAAMLNGGRRQVRYAAEASYAAQLAQNVLDAQGINGRLREGHDEGESDDGRVRWRLETREIADPLADPDTLDALQAAATEASGNNASDDATASATGPDLSGDALTDVNGELPWQLMALQLDLEWGHGSPRERASFATLHLQMRGSNDDDDGAPNRNAAPGRNEAPARNDAGSGREAQK
ncbi:MAG: hypothetical protein CVV12_06420 [Gammaproteobacteria bacterium HGW-Gammaproteobacteria-2]|jgi:general secretion pathway protein I|nr:MAG: hypothetical protein CVV12_06420 [Gammaproteobacteria bacterium HGW-Gammaproteobacteria-2]